MSVTFNRKCVILSSIFCIILLGIISFNYRLYIIDNKLNIQLFVFSLILPILFLFLFSVKLNFKEKINKCITIISFILSVFLSYIVIELLNKNNMFDITLKRTIFNLIVIVSLHLLIYAVSNKARFTIMLANSLIFLLGLVNYTIICFRGTPFVPWDILSLKTAAYVANSYNFIPSHYLIIAILVFILMISIAVKVSYDFKKTISNIILRFSALLIIILVTSSFYRTDIIKFFDFDTNLWEPVKEYSNNGFLASFAKQSKNLFNTEPQNYSVETVNNIIAEYIQNKKQETKINKDSPNIIVVMNESFSDLAVNGDFNVSEDYMPYYRSLKENTIKGSTYVSVIGGQTPNSEWEFLTNNSMAFMPYRTVPYQQYIHSNTYSIVNSLKDQGYNTSSVHPWYGSGYRRNAIYPLLGFESFDSLETMPDLEYLRDFPTDLSTYKHITKMFEEKDPDKKFFNFTVTMQNHSGYDFEGYDSTISLTNIPNCPNVEQYLSLVKESDDALKYLIDYFSKVKEPTIILFFGDHQPPYLEDEFWETISDPNTISKTNYITPFMLWANYDIPEKEIEYTSLNYLSLLLFDTAKLETTPYMKFLRVLQKEIPVITGNGYMDKKNNYYTLDEESKYSELIRNYQIVQYNNVFDDRDKIDEIFTIKK